MSETNKVPSDATPVILPSVAERFLAMTAHFSLFLVYIFLILAILLENPFSNAIAIGSLFIGPVLCLIIYFQNRNHSRFIAFHSLQALIFLLILYIVVGILLFIFRDSLEGEAAMGFALCAMPFELLWPLLALIAGIQSMRGKMIEYPFIGKWLKKLQLSK
jgi:uncharacterized Tic20 family protein